MTCLFLRGCSSLEFGFSLLVVEHECRCNLRAIPHGNEKCHGGDQERLETSQAMEEFLVNM